MNVVYSDQPINGLSLTTPSVFLAGPTPRDKNTKSWRPAAVSLFAECPWESKLTLFIPERSNKEYALHYDDQVEWERKGLAYASVIFFWVPRKLDTMPAFTTNVEFGYWIACRPGDVIYGRPEDSEKNRYLDWLYTKETRHTPIKSLEILVNETLLKLERKFNK